MNFNNNQVIKIKANVDPGINETVVDYEWYIDSNLIENKTDVLMLDLSTLNLGEHEISLKAKNSCGKWSDKISKTITIVEGEIMEKTVNILVDEPIENVTVVMDYIGAVNVTVTDQLNRPVVNANVSIGTITGTTDTFGKATLNNVPYGSQTLTVVV